MKMKNEVYDDSQQTNAPAGWAYYKGVPAGDLSVVHDNI